MTTQIALFRGINVGKAKRIAMTDLKAMFEALGFTDVRTLLNSGNVVFKGGRRSPAANAGRIASALVERAGFAANTLVIDGSTLQAIVEANPFLDRIDDPSRMLVVFLLDTDARAPLEALRRQTRDGSFAVGAHAGYLWCPDGILESATGETLAGSGFRDRVTTRNWSTTLKLLAMANAMR